MFHWVIYHDCWLLGCCCEQAKHTANTLFLNDFENFSKFLHFCVDSGVRF